MKHSYDIVNTSFNLEEKMFDFIVARKILISRPERFQPKITEMKKVRMWIR